MTINDIITQLNAINDIPDFRTRNFEMLRYLAVIRRGLFLNNKAVIVVKCGGDHCYLSFNAILSPTKSEMDIWRDKANVAAYRPGYNSAIVIIFTNALRTVEYPFRVVNPRVSLVPSLGLS